ncbi:FBD-associated F-box protein At5g60610 isoform X6 [Gossypium hirsutum]|uniref:FBD-associated F-box protein At5g60610 isoform X6 n=1 Tax=Gossypium hirsutum TaxID=3635 RepID=A0ABM2ZNK0_GOSHI|nr:FBD-associated F-box protein At5g60610 isoform X6 [Gossypium hirsutum]
MAMCVEDGISSFPDHILFHILSFLPIKEAVRTSIISTKWRYLFASISTIEFDGYLMRGLTDRNVDSFKNFVDRLLKFPDQEIDLDLKNLGDTLPALLFTCHSLVTLKLDAVGSEIKVPSDVCLGNLKTLQLRNSIFRTSRLPIFHNLIEFKYLGVGFNGRETWLVEFLHCVPNLKTLTLNFPSLGRCGNSMEGFTYESSFLFVISPQGD